MNKHGSTSTIDSFATDPIPKLIIKNSIPALIAMVMVMVYNIADTFFLGLTHNDLAVTAVSFASPLFMIFMSIGTLFGVGGTSVISRALGAGKNDYAKKACSFCMWSCVIIGVVLMAVMWVYLDKLTVMLGAVAESQKLTRDYLSIAIGCGAFSVISNCFSNVLRAEGQAMKAMTGSVIGNLVNLILDPIMILGFKWGVTGAAAATVIGNVIAALYYIIWFVRGKSNLSISIRHFSMKDGILKGVLAVGISASLANLLVSISSIIVNGLLAKYESGDMLVAGYGVTSKVVMIVTLIGIGIGSGVQPVMGYCYGAKNKKRLMESIRFSTVFAIIFCLIIGAICFLFAGPIVKVFLSDERSLSSAVHFTRILMTTGWLIGSFAICQNSLQAMGAATPALLASLFRQGIIFIPAVIIMRYAFGVDGMLWAQPIADLISQILVIFMLTSKIRKSDFTATETNK